MDELVVDLGCAPVSLGASRPQRLLIMTTSRLLIGRPSFRQSITPNHAVLVLQYVASHALAKSSMLPKRALIKSHRALPVPGIVVDLTDCNIANMPCT